MPLGLIAAVGPWVAGSSGVAAAASTAAGALVMVLAVPRGLKEEQYGLWEKYIF